MKLRKNGKGAGPVAEHLVGAILGLVFVIILIFAGYMVYKFITERDPVELCKLSVVAKAGTTYAGAELTSPFKDLNCQTTRITISEKGIKSSKPGEDKKFSDDKTKNSNFVKKVIADELHDCWYQFGEGKINFWGDFDSGKRCVICSDIRFDDSAKDKNKLPPTIEDFGKYLFTEFKPGTSYYDFLTSGSRGDLGSPITDTGKTVIDTGKGYSVLHVTAKEDLKVKAIGAALAGAIIGCKVGATAGTIATSWTGPGAAVGGAVGGAAGCLGGFIVGIGTVIVTKDSSSGYIVGTNFIKTEDITEACDRLY